VERDVRASSLLAVLQDKLNLAPESAVLTYKGQVCVMERLSHSMRAVLSVSRDSSCNYTPKVSRYLRV
jgi:hypothetical protein